MAAVLSRHGALPDRAANKRPNNGCVSAITCTSHGNSAQLLQSVAFITRLPVVAPRSQAPGKRIWPSVSRSGPAKPVTESCSPPPRKGWRRLGEAHHGGGLQQELIRLGRYPLLVVDDVGYIPFEPEAANLFFQLVSSRYERASLIVTSNKPFGAGVKCSATTS